MRLSRYSKNDIIYKHIQPNYNMMMMIIKQNKYVSSANSKFSCKTILTAAIIMLSCLAAVIGILIYNGVLWFVYPNMLGYSVKGVDVARYQGTVDWELMASQNIRFVFAKATEGATLQDPMFEKNMLSSRRHGIYAGAYHYMTTTSSGLAQANNFLDVITRYAMDLPPALDFEITPSANDNDKVKVKNEVKAFLNEVEDRIGIKPIIYATYECYNAYLANDFSEYSFWMRDLLRPPRIKDNRNWLFWQYCNRGRLKGIDKRQKYIDLNVFNGGEAEFEAYISGLSISHS